jgi:hypothetical protein
MFNQEKKRGKELQNKEEVYEAEILPFLKQIYDICKERGIPFMASFQAVEGELRGTCIIPPEANERLHMAYAVLNNDLAFSVISQVSEEPIKMVD